MEYYVCPIVIFYLGCKMCFAGGLRMTAGGTQRYQYVVPEFTPPEAEGHPMELHVKPRGTWQAVTSRSFFYAFT